MKAVYEAICYQCGSKVQGWFETPDGPLCGACARHEALHKAVQEHYKAHVAMKGGDFHNRARNIQS